MPLYTSAFKGAAASDLVAIESVEAFASRGHDVRARAAGTLSKYIPWEGPGRTIFCEKHQFIARNRVFVRSRSRQATLSFWTRLPFPADGSRLTNI
jgi:hypothetical protein